MALLPRAVQRSIYDTHSEDGADAAKGDAMASVCDIVNAIGCSRLAQVPEWATQYPTSPFR